jgi:hypothetical protein
MRQQEVNVVYTATGQTLDLIKSGCDQFANYVESGQRVGNLILGSPEMVIGKTVHLTSRTRGPRFLSTGFSQPEPWGTWADGFNSSIQMRPVKPVESLQITFDVGVRRAFGGPTRIETFVNGTRKRSTAINRGKPLTEVQVPSLQTNDVVSFQFVCERTMDEVQNVSRDESLRECLKVRSFKIEP